MDKIFAAGPSITDHEVEVVLDAMKNGWYENAYDYCEKFQNEFSQYHGRKFGIMTPNCTTSIHLLLTGLGIGPGDEVIVPDCTWVGSTAGIKYLGAKTVFADIDSTHWCVDVNSIKEQITQKTKAIIAVDLFGNMPDWDALNALSKEFNIPVIEDAAEAVGSIYKGRKAGSFGVGSVFSFHRTKTICTGEGGMLLLDDEELWKKCMFWRDHGRKPEGKAYYNYEVTYKYMPFNVQAALGYAQFQRVEELIKMKRHHLNKYKEQFANYDQLQFNVEPEGGQNGAWITGLVLGEKYNLDKLTIMEKLAPLGIPVRPFFYPLSMLPAYDEEARYRPLNKVAYKVSERGVNLPGALNITDEQIEFVASKFIDLIEGKL